MRRLAALLAAALLALLAGASPAVFAWGGAGHRLTGAIADQLLTPRARAAVRALLADDMDKLERPSGRTTLEAVSVWADEIRRTRADRPGFHFDDMPVCGAIPPARPWCQGRGSCASAELVHARAQISDPTLKARQRDEALKWIVHLVGDLHQPLHAADNDDRGGNRVQVALEGVKTRGATSLHGAWDSELVALAFDIRANKAPPPGLVRELAREARALPPEQLAFDPARWAAESNALARSVAYHYAGFACGAPPEQIVVLPRSYQADAERVIRTRIVLAGARLAALLNAVLDR